MIITLDASPGPTKTPMQSQETQLDLLIAQVALRDRSALKSIFEIAAPRLLGVLVRMLQGRGVAEDVLQDVLS